MKKFYLNITLIILILTLIIYGAIFINKYRNELVKEKSNTEYLNKKIKINEIVGEGYSIQSAKKTDDAIILIASKIINENDKEYKVIFCDIKTLKVKKELPIYNTDLEILGVDEKIYIGIKDKDYEYEKIDVVKKDKYEIERSIQIPNNLKIMRIIMNDEKILYTTEDGLFVSNMNFEGKNMLIDSKISKTDITASENYFPLDFYSEKEIIYKKVGYEWSCGIGKYNLETKENVFYDKLDTEYLKDVKGNNNNVYIYNSFTVLPLTKLNFNTLETETIIENTQTDTNIYNLSLKGDKVAYIRERYNIDGVIEKEAVIYNVITKEELVKKLGSSNSETNGIIYNILNDNNLIVICTDCIQKIYISK